MTDKSRPLLAAAWMTGAIFSFSSMAVAGRAINHELDTFEMMMYRSLIGLVIIVCIGLALGKLPEARTNRLGLHIIRNLAHFAGQNLWFYALGLISLAQLFALEFTSPIWIMILAALLLGERLTGSRLAALALGFIGAAQGFAMAPVLAGVAVTLLLYGTMHLAHHRTWARTA